MVVSANNSTYIKQYDSRMCELSVIAADSLEIATSLCIAECLRVGRMNIIYLIALRVYTIYLGFTRYGPQSALDRRGENTAMYSRASLRNSLIGTYLPCSIFRAYLKSKSRTYVQEAKPPWFPFIELEAKKSSAKACLARTSISWRAPPPPPAYISCLFGRYAIILTRVSG